MVGVQVHSLRMCVPLYRTQKTLGFILLLGWGHPPCTLLQGATFDALAGLAVGSVLVLGLFAAEVGLGWIKITGYMQTAVPGESLWHNLGWDVVFHIAVSINEELSMRGWLLLK